MKCFYLFSRINNRTYISGIDNKLGLRIVGRGRSINQIGNEGNLLAKVGRKKPEMVLARFLRAPLEKLQKLGKDYSS